jgi:hypothetical protein
MLENQLPLISRPGLLDVAGVMQTTGGVRIQASETEFRVQLAGHARPKLFLMIWYVSTNFGLMFLYRKYSFLLLN